MALGTAVNGISRVKISFHRISEGRYASKIPLIDPITGQDQWNLKKVAKAQLGFFLTATTTNCEALQFLNGGFEGFQSHGGAPTHLRFVPEII